VRDECTRIDGSSTNWKWRGLWHIDKWNERRVKCFHRNLSELRIMFHNFVITSYPCFHNKNEFNPVSQIISSCHLINRNIFIKSYSMWCTYKNLGLKYLFFLWSYIRVLLLLIWWPLKAYMVVNLKIHEINRGTHKLIRTLKLIRKKNCVDNITPRYNIKAFRSNYILIKIYI